MINPISVTIQGLFDNGLSAVLVNCTLDFVDTEELIWQALSTPLRTHVHTLLLGSCKSCGLIGHNQEYNRGGEHDCARCFAMYYEVCSHCVIPQDDCSWICTSCSRF